MPRKPGAGRKTARRSRYTAAQIAEFRRRDDDLMSRSTEHLEDGPGVRRFARHAASGGVSARILGYSLRNQMLLERQAADRGFVLTDVDTRKGWRKRGRRLKKDETGLRLIKPVGEDSKDSDPDADLAHDEPERGDDEDQDAADADARSVRFRTVAVFDIVQTEPLREADTEECGQCGAEPGQPCNPGCTCRACEAPNLEDAAETLWNNLYEQITIKAGYAIDWPAPAAALNGERIRVDHDARTVYVEFDATADAPDAVAELAAALAEIIARSDRAADARRTQRKAMRALTAQPANT